MFDFIQQSYTMKHNTNKSQDLRNQIQNLAVARQSLEKHVDISGSVVKIANTLHNIKPLLNKQTQYIKNFLQAGQSNDTASKQAQTRRYLSRICDICLNEINQIFTAAQNYFVLDIKTSWIKIKNQFQRKLFSLKEQNDKANIVQFLFKITNMREKLLKQFFKSILYRKCLLWKDLNIVDQGYVHSEKKQITKSIEDYIMNKKYAPTRPFFIQPDMEAQGQWNLNKVQTEQSSISQFLKLVNIQIQQLFRTIRNYSNLNEQQRSNEDIRRNSDQVRSLRQQIEQSFMNYQIMQRKYRDAINKDERADMVELKQRLKIAEQIIQTKELEIKQLKFSYRDYARDMTAQKEKIKELESDLEKITNVEMKKLKEVQIMQSTLADQFSRILKNMNSFGTMFEFQSQGKKSLVQEIIKLKETIQKMAILLGKNKNQNAKLKQQIQRLNIVILQLGQELKRR